MNKDPILASFLELSNRDIDDRLKQTILKVIESINLKLDTDNHSAIQFLITNFPYIGSLSDKAEKAREESILTGAWPGQGDSLCIELSLDNTQRDAVFSCFADAKSFGCYQYKEPQNVIFHFFESARLRFRVNLSSKGLTIIIRKNDCSVAFDEEIDKFLDDHAELRNPIVKMADA
ncbi:MAG TPA: hypothetical protein VHQ41_02780 [Patescibacteria group bacterium]|jgi:hypothetical protein|nr:hypothetical protein [Patescibacteria group bacterium]